MTDIHATAVVAEGTKLGANSSIGPFCIVGPDVVLGDNVVLDSHVVVDGVTRLGNAVRVFPYSSVGYQPQDLKYAGEKSRLEIGDNTQIREHVTVHTGTEGGGMVTRIGANCLIMVGVHVAHDCQIGDNVILVNNVVLGGHVKIGEFAMVGGISAVHQFVRIGQHAMVAGASGVDADVIPYGMAIGNRAHLNGLNLIGLRRRGFPKDEIHALRAAYRNLFADDGLLLDRVGRVGDEFTGRKLVGQVLEFIRADTSRALCQPKS